MSRAGVVAAIFVVAAIGCRNGSSASAPPSAPPQQAPPDGGTPDASVPTPPTPGPDGGTGDGGWASGPPLPANVVSTENANPGTTDWKIRRPGLADISGYALVDTVSAGDKLSIAVSTSSVTTFSWAAYRLGYYGGTGARQLASGGPVNATPQATCGPTAPTGLVACSWTPTFTVDTSGFPRGVYLVRLTRTDGPQSYVPFVVRDGSTPAVIAILPETTWAAYNVWGGESLYDDQRGVMPSGHAWQVSFDRPFLRDFGAGDLLTHDRSLIAWLEAQGVDVAFVTSQELDRRPSLVQSAKAIFVSGHDEYWTWTLRKTIDQAVASGTSLLLLGANAAYWHVRLEATPDGRDRRIVTCYKKDAPSKDPAGTSSADLTLEFRQPPLAYPENQLFGVMFNGHWNQFAYPAVIALSDHWALSGTGLKAGDVLWQAAGYEADEVVGSPLAGTDVLASSPLTTVQGGFGVSNMVIRQQGNALVFAAGGIDFVNLLASDRAADPRAGRLIANVLFRALGVSVPSSYVDFPRAPRATATGPFASQVKTIAGVAGSRGDVDGAAGTGRLLGPMNVAPLPNGALAVLDSGAQKLKRVEADGTIHTLDVNGLYQPIGLAADSAGNVYVADGNQTIRVVRADGSTAEIAGTHGAAGMRDGAPGTARFNTPAGLALDGSGGLLVADLGNGAIRRVELSSGNVSTVASNLYRPSAVALGADGTIYVVETGTCRVLAIRSGQVQALAGDGAGFAEGAGASARLMPFLGIAVLADGSLAVSDPGNYRIRRIKNGAVSTLAGSGGFGARDGTGDQSDLVAPAGLAVRADGTLLVADSGNGAIRAIQP